MGQGGRPAWYAKRTVRGLGDDGGPDVITLWIERKPGAVWAVGRAVNLDERAGGVRAEASGPAPTRRPRPGSQSSEACPMPAERSANAGGQAGRIAADEPSGPSPWRSPAANGAAFAPAFPRCRMRKTLAGIGVDSRSKSM